MKRLPTAVVMLVLIAGGGVTGSETAQAASPPTLATLTGGTDLPNGQAVVEVEYASAPNALGIPTVMTDVAVSGTVTDADGKFAVALPDTAQVQEAAINGIVETLTVVRAGGRTTGSYTPVALPGSGEPTQATSGSGGGRTIDEGQLPVSVPTSDPSGDAVPADLTPDDDTTCQWTLGSTHEGSSRVGELHVNTTGGASGKFVYRQTADSTFTVGFKIDSESWSPSGSYTVSNTIGTTAAYSEPNISGFKSRTYAVDHMYYGEWYSNGWGGCPGYRVQTHATESVGDVFIGVNTPSEAPWPSCHADPYGYGTVEAGGSFDADRSQAENYDYVDEIYGFKFGGHTGYTNGIHIEYTGGSVPTYICGQAHMSGVPVIYHRSW